MKKILRKDNKFIRFIKPPSATLNTNKRKIKNIIKKAVFQDKKILDIGSGGRNFDEKVIKIDLVAYDNVNLIADAHKLPFKENSFDLIIATAVLEHVKEPANVVEEIWRSLKPKSTIYVEIPFLQGYHADPNDFQRYTIQGIKSLFKKFEEIESGACSGPFSVLTWYLRKFPTIFFKSVYIIKMIEFLFGWLFFVVKYLDYIFVRARNCHVLSSALYFIGSKKI